LKHKYSRTDGQLPFLFLVPAEIATNCKVPYATLCLQRTMLYGLSDI
jgi:hypothetical protein